MIIDSLVQDDSAPVEGVEVHVERVNEATTVVIDNDSNASSSFCLSATVRLDAVEPSRVGGNINIRGEVDFGTINGIQSIKIVKCQWVWVVDYGIEVDFWLGIDKLGSDITGEICLS